MSALTLSTSKPAATAQSQANVLQEFLAKTSDNNVVQLVLSYVGDPSIPQMDDTGFKFILDAYNEKGFLSRLSIDPAQIPANGRRQAIMDIYERVVKMAGSADFLRDVQAVLRKDGASLTLGAISPIMEVIAPNLDKDIDKIFRGISKQIPEAKAFLQSDEIMLLGNDHAAKAELYRKWIQDNRNLLSQHGIFIKKI